MKKKASLCFIVSLLAVLLFGCTPTTIISVQDAGKVVSIKSRQDISGIGYSWVGGDIEEVDTTNGVYFLGGLHSFSKDEEIYIVSYKTFDRGSDVVECLQNNTDNSFSDNQCQDGAEVIK